MSKVEPNLGGHESEVKGSVDIVPVAGFTAKSRTAESSKNDRQKAHRLSVVDERKAKSSSNVPQVAKRRATLSSDYVYEHQDLLAKSLVRYANSSGTIDLESDLDLFGILSLLKCDRKMQLDYFKDVAAKHMRSLPDSMAVWETETFDFFIDMAGFRHYTVFAFKWICWFGLPVLIAAYTFKSKRVPVSLMLVLAEHVLLGGVHACWLALSYLNMFHREGKGAGDRYDKEELCDFSVVDHCFTALAVTTKTTRSKFPFRFQSTNRRSNDSSPPLASPPHKFPNHATTAEAVDTSERRFSFERGKTSQNLLSFETIMSDQLIFDPEIDAYAMSTLQRSGIDRVLYGAFFLYGLCSNLGAAYEVALCLQRLVWGDFSANQTASIVELVAWLCVVIFNLLHSAMACQAIAKLTMFPQLVQPHIKALECVVVADVIENHEHASVLAHATQSVLLTIKNICGTLSGRTVTPALLYVGVNAAISGFFFAEYLGSESGEGKCIPLWSVLTLFVSITFFFGFVTTLGMINMQLDDLDEGLLNAKVRMDMRVCTLPPGSKRREELIKAGDVLKAIADLDKTVAEIFGISVTARMVGSLWLETMSGLVLSLSFIGVFLDSFTVRYVPVCVTNGVAESLFVGGNGTVVG